MSDQPPKGPGWGNAPGGPSDRISPDSIGHLSERDRIDKLREKLPSLLEQFDDKIGGRAERFYPYLLVRSIVGDRGDRPINIPFWESPDIWTAPGDPATSPATPATHGGELTAGAPHTVYAHVWNLGRAPIAGVKVEFYWFNPALSVDDAHAHLIGMTRVDLGPRSSQTCHRLVKCPKPWTPHLIENGHECLVVRATAIGDGLGATHPWDAWANRHVGQRNVHVAAARTNLGALVGSLDATRPPQTRVQLLQVGQQAEMTLRLAAPNLKLDPAVQTLVLAEIRADGSLHLPGTSAGTAGGHAVVAGAAAPTATGAFAVPRIVPSTLLEIARPAVQAGRAATTRPTEVLSSGANLHHLVGHDTLLAPEVVKRITQLKLPAAGQAHVLRIISFLGDQMVGGYTIVVRGR